MLLDILILRKNRCAGKFSCLSRAAITSKSFCPISKIWLDPTPRSSSWFTWTLTASANLPVNFLRSKAVSLAIFPAPPWHRMIAASRNPNLTQRLERASRELRDHGVQIEVKFYSGRLRPLLRQYNEVEATSLVIMRPAINRARRWLRSLIAALGIARPSSAMPVRLCHPADFTSRDL